MKHPPFKTKKGICEFPPPHSFCQSQKEQELVGYVWRGTEKFSACETCYQKTKQNQWQINGERGLINVKGFYFYDEARQKLEDQAQLADYYRRQELEEIKEPNNEHRAGFVDQSVIDFLGAKGGNCCQKETCEGGESVNQYLKKDLFTSEQEGKDFKERGVYPTKHQTNGAKLSPEEQARIKRDCGSNWRNQLCPEKLLLCTGKKVQTKEKDQA